MNTHEQTALDLFGVANDDTVDRAKAINFASMYGAGGIRLGRMAGQYPVKGAICD